MQESSALVEIEAESYKWTYPIKGIPDLISASTIELKCRAREQVEIITELHLTHLDTKTYLDWNDVFELDLNTIPLNLRKQMRVSVIESFAISTGTMGMKLKCIFMPQCPIDVIIKLAFIHKTHHGRWIFPIKLFSIPPVADDTIVVQGSVKKKGSVSFSLNNVFGRPLKFKAYFHRTSADLIIKPEYGILIADENRNPKDNTFVLSYEPHVDGKSTVGLLIIEVLRN
jgi:hypothetical protein